MAVNLPTIPPFDAGSNPSEAWRNWKQDFEDYIEALRYGGEPEKTKTALFRHVCGDELKKQFRTFHLAPEAGQTEVSLKQIINEFDKYYKEFQNEIFASFKFLEMKQERGETFSDFYVRLRSAVTDCNYGESTERMLRDKIIQGLLDKPLQERLIRETSRKAKTLQEVISDCKTAEHSKEQASQMNETRPTVDAINRKSHAGASRNHRSCASKAAEKKNQQPGFQCRNCGRSHEPRNCPAFGTKCRKCQKNNHWASVCKSNIPTRNNGHNRRINVIEANSDPDSVYLGELKSVGALDIDKSESTWFQKVHVNGKEIIFKLDTGAQVNVIPKSVLSNWEEKPIITKIKQPVLDYSDNEIPIIGECTMTCKTSKVTENLNFVVTALESSPILGLQACKKLGLLKRLSQINKHCRNSRGKDTPEQVLEDFTDVFTGIGRLNRTVKIKLKDDVTPHVAAPRKVPLALHEEVKIELQRMVETGVISKVDEPTDWVSNMVVVKTAKKLRICIDPRPLNEAIQRPHYQIPSVERLITKLQGCKFFTIIDAKNGFWQLPLDEQSSYLTTFTTPWGRYRFLVLPFGLNNAPEEFQRTMDEIFEQETSVNPYFDDIVLGSASLEEHCELLRRTLTLARNANLKFNAGKTQLALSSVNYLGHIISDKGIKPDPDKVKSISEFAVPCNREDLQRFLGMVTYLAKFTPHLSSLTHSLRQLLKRDTEWLWDQNIQRDFDVIKKTIIQAPCLQYFDNTKPVTVSVDASKNGIGAVLLQESKPVAFGSMSLTSTQQRYAQIEKELFAVIYGLEHFNYYTYGRPIIIQTDHKPLLGLSKKPYDTISPRLQRMLLRLNRYNVCMTYVPGKQLLIADALSRAQLPETSTIEDVEPEADVKVCLLATASPPKWKEYSRLTSSDTELVDVMYHIENGWPDKVQTRIAAQAYWHCKEELYITKDGILCRGQRLIVPSTARKDILQKLHISHRGIVSCKTKAREYFYWPSIDKDIEKFVGSCKICQEHQRANQKETLLDRDLPERPWQKVACDFLQLKSRHFLLMVDYFSKYVEIQLMSNTTAQAVIRAMKSIFARHGIPEELVSDGGPPFNSWEIQKFFEEWDVSHDITSPHFPRANGQVERTIQTLKKTMIKAEKEGKDLYVVLLDYRIQPSVDLPSPAELLMGRRLRSFLPTCPDRLQPNFPTEQAKEALKKRQDNQKKHGNRNATQHSEFKERAKVWFRHRMTEPWKQGTIIQVGPQPRSYIIQARDGTTYRRNRIHIRPDRSVDSSNHRAIQHPARNVEDFYSIPAETTTQPQQKQPNSQPNNRPNRNRKKPQRYRDTQFISG